MHETFGEEIREQMVPEVCKLLVGCVLSLDMCRHGDQQAFNAALDSSGVWNACLGIRESGGAWISGKEYMIDSI